MSVPPDPILSLEQAVFMRDHTRSLLTLEAVFRHLDARMNTGADGLFDHDEQAVRQATRLASVICTILTDPALPLTPEWYCRLVPFKRQIQAIFDVSGFQGTSLPLRYMSDGAAYAATPEQETSQLLKMLLVMGIEDAAPQLLEVIRRLDANVTAPLVAALVSSKVVITKAAWEGRERLLDLTEQFDHAALLDYHVQLLGTAWMHCSYAVRADRHDFKAALNRWLLRGLGEHGLAAPAAPGVPIDAPRKARPRLVIVAEVLWDGHAMFRCYASRIEELKSRFETVLVARDGVIDDAARALVDRTVPFPSPQLNIGGMAEHVRRLEPDLLYYPSLGLEPWAVALANLRLAPIQFMTPGHPATSATETIDYLLLTRPAVGDPSAYTERVVIAGEARFRQSSYGDVEVPSYRREDEGAPVAVAVAAYSMKLSWPLVDALRQVQDQARSRIEWHFFANEVGLIRQHVRVALERVLDNVTVHPRAPYARYLEALGRCQLAVGTFPFGGSNSNVDVLRIGIPKVAVDGREAMERADVTSLRRLEGLDDLIADTPEAFIGRTVALIDDPDGRERISQRIREQDPTSRFLADEQEGQPFVEAVWFMYTHHGEPSNDLRAPIDPWA